MPRVKASHLIAACTDWQRIVTDAPGPLGRYDKIALAKHLSECAEEIDRVSDLINEYAEEAARASLKSEQAKELLRALVRSIKTGCSNDDILEAISGGLGILPTGNTEPK